MPWSGTPGVDGEVRTEPAPAHRYLWSDGYVSQSHDFLGGPTTITVRLAGELLGGVGPHVVVSVGGVEVGAAYVNETSYTSKSFAFQATPGAKDIRVTFDNDDGNGTEDRNLLLDWIEVDEPAPEPACSDATYQAEEMPWSGTDGVDGEVRTDPAPTHRYFWTDGYIHKNHVFAAGPTRIRVRAMGEPLGGIGPHMFVSVGGVEIGSAYIDGSGYVDKTFEFTASAGAQEIRVTYDNDEWIPPGDPGNDRNLLVDEISVLCGASSDGGAGDQDGGAGDQDGGASGGDAGECTPSSCTTADPCKVADCTPGGCVISDAADGTACGGTTCTGVARCQAGTCVPATPECTSSNPCVVATCDEVNGCQLTAAPAGTACGSPPDMCSTAPTCDGAGTCQQGQPVTCTSSNPCMTASCDPNVGCVTSPVADGTLCDTDMDQCNGVDSCQSGQCVAGTPPDCTSSDPCQVGSCDVSAGCVLTPAPPGTPGCVPVIEPTPLDPTLAVRMADATAFLYSGSSPVQTGVAPGTISPERVAVVRGRILDADGVTPRSGATVTILGHPELGQTLTRANGEYDLAINGGGTFVVDVRMHGYLPVQRRSSVAWHGWAIVDDIVLTQAEFSPDVFVTGSATPQIVRGHVTPAGEDADGARQAVIIFPPDTHITNYPVADGTPLEVQITEYTRGAQGPQRMPGDLPPTSGYTYAFELGIPAAIAAGVSDVQFDRDVPVYIDNFTHYPVGEPVPLGYYDRAKGAWMAEKSGRIIKILTTDGGTATVDVTGDGVADTGTTLSDLGITTSELQALASQYAAGAELWRVVMRHFSPWDCNWGFGPADDAKYPPDPDPKDDNPDCKKKRPGSIIGCESRTLGEEIPITGTPFALHYESDRTPGFWSRFRLQVNGEEPLPESFIGALVEIRIAGRQKTFSLGAPLAPNTTIILSWDGKDAYGRDVGTGTFDANVRLGYVYAAVTRSTSSFAASPGGMITGNRAARTITLWRERTVPVSRMAALPLGFGGWTLDAQHVVDVEGKTIHYGSGSRRSVGSGLAYMVETIAGGGTNYTATGPATQAGLLGLQEFARAPDGSLYILQNFSSPGGTVRRISPDGIISTVAGLPPVVPKVDGGPALHAQVFPIAVALGPDGSIYFAELYGWNGGKHQVWKITPGPEPTLHLVAGIGAAGPPSCPTPASCGDGADARTVPLRNPHALAVAPDGALFIAEGEVNELGRVRRVGPEGTISTYFTSTFPRHLSLGQDGVLFVQHGEDSVARVEPDGTSSSANGAHFTSCQDLIATSVRGLPGVPLGDGSFITPCGSRIVRRSAGGTLVSLAGQPYPNWGYAGDGGPALRARLHVHVPLVLGENGEIFFYDASGFRIRRLRLPFGLQTGGTAFGVPTHDGSELHALDVSGKHIRTASGLTGAPRYTFGYDPSTQQLTSVVDEANNVTQIARAPGAVTITAPHGQVTTLTLDANGYLASITNPANETTFLAHSPSGLLTDLVDARGLAHHFEYDTYGRLTKDLDATPGSAGTRLDASTDTRGWSVEITSPEGRVTRHRVDQSGDFGDPAIVERRTITEAPGATELVTTAHKFADGAWASVGPDGTKVSVLSTAADPRFGTAASYASSIRTDVGFPSTTHSMTRTESRSATLATPGDPFSVTTQTITTTLSGGGVPTTTMTRAFAAGPPATWTTTSAAGRQSRATLDPLERVTSIAVLGSDPVTLHPIAYHYDERGRIDQITHGTRVYTTTFDPVTGWVESTTDPADLGVSYASRDANGRPLLVNLPGGRALAMSYDAAGNLLSVSPPSKPAHAFSWDPTDRLGAYAPPDLGFAPKDTTYTHDRDGLLFQVTPPGLIARFLRDEHGRTREITGVVTKNVAYDPQGRLESITTSDGVTLTYGYDGSLVTQQALSGPFSHAVNKTYDNFFRLASWDVDGLGSTSPTYDLDGFVTAMGPMTVTRGNTGLLKSTTLGAVTDTFTYNAFGEVIGHEVTGGATSYAATYTRDAAGRIDTKTETIDGTSRTERYTYDGAGRLWQVFVDGASTPLREYTYDANGNRSDGTYDAQDRQLSHGQFSFQYSSNGDLAVKTDNGALTHTVFDYDLHGNLRRVIPSAPLAPIEYVIDGLNRRIGKKVGGSLVQGFVYDGRRIVAELNASGGLVATFHYVTSGHSPDFMVKGDTTYRFVKDHLGSPRLVVDSSGAVAQRMDFDEWGNVTNDTNPGFQPFGFAGGLWDRDTNLVRFGARDYDAATGRWTSKDQSGFGGGLNLYAYAGNDPVNYVDITGFDRSSFDQVLFDAQEAGVFAAVAAFGTGLLDNIPLYAGLPGSPTLGDVADWAGLSARTGSGAGPCGGGGDDDDAAEKARAAGMIVGAATLGLARGVPTITRTMQSQSRVIARGPRIRDVGRLVDQYGGRARDWVKKSSQRMEIGGRQAEIHWYEARGIGRVEEKIVWLD